AEVGREVERAPIREHSARLLLELLRATELACRRRREQLIVGDAAPQEERQAGRQLEIADSVDAAGGNGPGFAFHAEQELRIDEHGAQRPLDAIVEILRGPPLAI